MLARAKWLLQILQLAKLHYDNPLDSTTVIVHPGYKKSITPWDLIVRLLDERKQEVVDSIYIPVWNREYKAAITKLYEYRAKRKSRN